jgi:hypothetical protein
MRKLDLAGKIETSAGSSKGSPQSASLQGSPAREDSGSRAERRLKAAWDKMKPHADAEAIGVGKRDTVAVQTEGAPMGSSPAAAAATHVDGVSVELPNYTAMGQLMGIYDDAMTHERVVELIR